MKSSCDMIILGGGPAGYTAALYGARAGLSVLVLEKMAPGGQMALTDVIDNYPGFDQGIDGFTLGQKMQAGAERFGAATQYAEVLSAELSGDVKKIVTSSGDFYGRTVVIATVQRLDSAVVMVISSSSNGLRSSLERTRSRPIAFMAEPMMSSFA